MKATTIFAGILTVLVLSVPLQAQLFTLGGRYPTAHYPYCVVSADFDGDLDIDLAVGHRQDTLIYIYTNDGNAGFTQSHSIPSFGMVELYSADLNGDNIADLMTQGEYGQPTVFYYNNGDGTFYVGFYREYEFRPKGLNAADFDGDNIIDVAVNHLNEGSGIFIIFGQGNGVFGDSTMIVPGVSGGYAIVSADLDNDGDIDIVFNGTISGQGGDHSILNNGDGTFAAPESTLGHLSSFVVTDFNHDQYPDLCGKGMYSCTHIPQYMLGTPDGRFTVEETAFLAAGWLSTQRPLPADFNGDGNTDIVICSIEQSYLLCGCDDGLQNFTVDTLWYGYTGATGMAAGDFDGDGDNDLAITNTDDNLTIVLSLASAHSNRILVPDDIPTIGEAIDYSWNLDTIIVQPGTYTELLNFDGKILILASQFLLTGDESYISSTIIDGGGGGSVITFENGEDSRAKVIGLTIQNGSAAGYGGGIFCYDVAGPTIMYNIIKNNYSGSVAGGIMIGGGTAVVKNNIISGNSCFNWGGGMFLTGTGAVVTSNTFYGNTAANDGGGVHFGYSSPEFYNNILWGNSATAEGDEIAYFGTDPPVITYCDIQGGYAGEGNIDIDPLFRDPTGGDLRLQAVACGDNADSPCIDTGDPAVNDFLLNCDWGLGAVRSDMGAYGGGESVVVGIEEWSEKLPQSYSLLQNYPNPFNARTTICYTLNNISEVTIEIYDLLGRRIDMIDTGTQPAGEHQLSWNAGDLPSGIYFYRIQAGDYAESRKMTLLK